MRKLALLFLLLLPLAAQAEEKAAIITVHGEAVTKIAPDQVTLPVTVHEENASINIAKEKHDEKLRALLNLAKEFGIKKEDMQTGYMSIEPIYDYEFNKQKLRGYQTQTSINFKLDDLSKLGEFIDQVIGLGITNIGSAYFSLKDETQVKEETLAKAVMGASEKARRIAETAKVSLDRPLAIEEGNVEVNRPFRPLPMMGVRAVAGPMSVGSAAPELPSGLIEIRQSVTVTYQLK